MVGRKKTHHQDQTRHQEQQYAISLRTTIASRTTISSRTTTFSSYIDPKSSKRCVLQQQKLPLGNVTIILDSTGPIWIKHGRIPKHI